MVAAAKASRVGSGQLLGRARPSRPALTTLKPLAERKPDDVWRQQEHRGLTARELIHMAQAVRLHASVAPERGQDQYGRAGAITNIRR